MPNLKKGFERTCQKRWGMSIKKMLLSLPDEIALLRENKDVGKDSIIVLDGLDRYVKILDKLLSYYKELAIAIEGL